MHASRFFRVCTVVACACCLVLSARLVWAHTPEQAPHQRYELKQLELKSGQRIAPFVQSYVTHGSLNATRDNAILMLAPFAGDHHHNEWLIGPGKPLDSNKYFIICADPIGNGLSSSPSTSRTQPRMQFPHYGITDMVNAQYRLVKEHLGINTLVAVLGASMGGMQSLQWAVSYPDMVQRVIALVPSAKSFGWLRTQLALLRQVITLDSVWNQGNYSTQPEKGLRLLAGIMFALNLHTPKQVNDATAAHPDVALQRLEYVQNKSWNLLDANDLLYQARAIENFQLSKNSNTQPTDKTDAAAQASEYTATLRALTTPVLILAGKNDLLCPEEAMREDAQLMPNARFELIVPEQELGHAAGLGLNPEARAFLAQQIAGFLPSL